MWLAKFLILLVVCFALVVGQNRGPRDDCDTLKARCDICVRTLHEGLNEDNIMGRLNRKCEAKVGRRYVWRKLYRCDIIYLHCRGINVKLDCEQIAKMAKMQRRLP